MKNQVLFLFAPLKERIWGSTYFKNQLNITDQDSIGEMWSCSGYEGSDSIIENGDFKGETLSSLFKNHKELFNNSKLNEFPILVKLIATSDDLSVQVHPDDKYAREVENQLGKTEGWLILDADSSSNIVVGHRAKNKEELIKYVENDDYENLLIKRNVKKGDFFPIPSGTIHALGKGIVLLEVQQSSDVTYRFYDYHRKDKNGNERELHVQKAIDVTDYVPYTNQIFNCLGKDKCIVWDNQYFQVEYLSLDDKYQFNNPNHEYFIVTLIEKNVEIEGRELKVGESVIITSNCQSITLKGDGKVLITKSKE